MDPNALHNISYGVYIVSSHQGGHFNGQIANTVFQVTSVPATIAVSINKANLTHEYIKSSGVFTVSILDEDTPLPFIGRFGFRSGRAEEKFKGVKYEELPSGCPVVTENAVCYLEAAVTKSFDCGTHTIFLGKVGASKILRQGTPMTYSYYHQVKKGTTPSSAPTFIKGEAPKRAEGGIMGKYRCVICNYIYDPALGDPGGGIKPGTPFEKLPDNWVCPVCGADKSQFVKEG